MTDALIKIATCDYYTCEAGPDQSPLLFGADQDEAIIWYTEKPGFEKRVDSEFGPGLRRLTIAPKGQVHPQIVLQKPLPDLYGSDWKQMMERVGEGTALVLESGDCMKDYQELSARVVNFPGCICLKSRSSGTFKLNI